MAEINTCILSGVVDSIKHVEKDDFAFAVVTLKIVSEWQGKRKEQLVPLTAYRDQFADVDALVEGGRAVAQFKVGARENKGFTEPHRNHRFDRPGEQREGVEEAVSAARSRSRTFGRRGRNGRAVLKQANPDWWIQRTFFRSNEPCCVCDESKGDVRIVMDRPHRVECFQKMIDQSIPKGIDE